MDFLRALAGNPAHVEAQPQQQAPPPAQPSSNNNEVLQDLVAALNSAQGFRPGGRRPPSSQRTSTLPRPDPNFMDGGCWHCGDKTHKRVECPVFKDILAANQEKLPELRKSSRLGDSLDSAMYFDDGLQNFGVTPMCPYATLRAMG